MKFNEFQKKMKKPVFTVEEAHRVAFEDPPKQVNLQLHQWTHRKEIIHLCRGYYAFPDRVTNQLEVAKYLYVPSYVSLEYALNAQGLIPDVPFGLTLVTPRTTRTFDTPLGRFYFRRLQPKFFWGYDPTTLMGEKEKVLLDYFYFNSHQLKPEITFWEEFRLQNARQLDLKKLERYAKKFGSKKIMELVASMELYLKNYGTSKKNH